jgi:glycosyltransferase involved in cell wall biosynthesis
MSMGLPVITTRWGGSMGFLRDSNSFLINLDACEEDSPSSWYGWKLGKKWATPSVDHLKELMTTLFIDQEYGRLVGARARADVVENFSEEVVVDLLQKRLEVVRTKYFRGEYNNSKRRLRKCAP